MTVQPTTLVAQLVEILNHNFAYLESIAGGGTGQKHIAHLSGVSGQHAIEHGLDSTSLMVQCWSSAGELVIPGVQIITPSIVQVTFETQFSGRVIVKRTGARTHVAPFSTATGQHTVVHDLGSLDVFAQCYDSDGYAVMCPMQVLTPIAVRVTFDAPFTGKVIITL